MQFFFQHTNIDSIEGYLIALSFIIAVIYVVKNVYLTFEQNVILSFSYRTRMNLATRLLTTYMNEPYTFHLSKNIAEMQEMSADRYNTVYDVDQFWLAAGRGTCNLSCTWTLFISYKPFYYCFNRASVRHLRFCIFHDFQKGIQ